MSRPLKLAVFGDPVDHSLSPAIHALFARQLGVAVDYSRIRSTIEQLPDRIARFVADGGTGANLTVPLKQAGMRLCRQLDRAARQARAVNTLNLEDGSWHGSNTDGAGLLLDFERLQLDTSGAHILIIGAGGATAGLIGPLLATQPAAVTILNRTRARAIELAERFEHLGPIDAEGLGSGPVRGDYAILIQATSLGHRGKLANIDPAWLAPDTIAYDLNYGPAHQPFQSWCHKHHLSCHDGLGMLVGQAALAFEIWTGKRPKMAEALERLKAQGARLKEQGTRDKEKG